MKKSRKTDLAILEKLSGPGKIFCGLNTIPVMGDLTEIGPEIARQLLALGTGNECTLLFDSGGGSSYTAMALATILIGYNLQSSAVVIGECSSAALWVFAACQNRFVFPHSVLLFHHARWDNVGLQNGDEAATAGEHLRSLQEMMDSQLAAMFNLPLKVIKGWSYPGQYISPQVLTYYKVTTMLPSPMGD